MAMTAPDGARRANGTGPGSYPPGSKRPKEARRPERPSSSPESTAIHLCPATFVDLTDDQERQAIEALAELMVPLLISNAARSTLATAIGHTGDSATYATFGTVDGEP